MTDAIKRLRNAKIRLRLAGLFVALGLLVEWLSLAKTTPSTFLVFGIAMGICFPIGTLLFLSTLITKGPNQE